MTGYVPRIMILLGLLCICAHAQDLETVEKESSPPTVDGKLLTLVSLSYAAALYDMQTTFAALERCHPQCIEANPLMSPFVANRTAGYAFSVGLTSVSTYATYRLKKKGARWWWIPMAASAALHITAGIHNQNIKPPTRTLR